MRLNITIQYNILLNLNNINTNPSISFLIFIIYCYKNKSNYHVKIVIPSF